MWILFGKPLFSGILGWAGKPVISRDASFLSLMKRIRIWLRMMAPSNSIVDVSGHWKDPIIDSRFFTKDSLASEASSPQFLKIRSRGPTKTQQIRRIFWHLTWYIVSHLGKLCFQQSHFNCLHRPPPGVWALRFGRKIESMQYDATYVWLGFRWKLAIPCYMSRCPINNLSPTFFEIMIPDAFSTVLVFPPRNVGIVVFCWVPHLSIEAFAPNQG